MFGYGYYDHGHTIQTEESPFGQPRGDGFDPHMEAMLSTEQQVFDADGIDGISLRYGLLYGEDIDKVVGVLRKRALPVPKAGGLLPFVHHRDAAAATVAALTLGRPGVHTTSSMTSRRPFGKLSPPSRMRGTLPGP